MWKTRVAALLGPPRGAGTDPRGFTMRFAPCFLASLFAFGCASASSGQGLTKPEPTIDPTWGASTGQNSAVRALRGDHLPRLPDHDEFYDPGG